MGWGEVEQAFAEAVERGVIPGATLIVRREADIAFEGAFGHRALVPERSPMKMETVFDLSSLTKPLATTVAVMMLVRENKLRLADRVTRFFHNFGVHDKGHVTFRHLLAHCSGLAAWRPFFQQVVQVEKSGKVNFMASHGAKEWVYEEIHRERLEAPSATKAIYSDLNFMLLGEAVERVAGVALNRFCRDRIFRPLGIRATDFIDISLVRSRRLEPVAEMFAPTSFCAFRKRLLVGEVDDENAYAMGGVAGHAGLFAPVARRRPYRTGVDRLLRRTLRVAAAEGGARVLDSRHHGQRIDLGARMGHAVGAVLELGASFLAHRRRPSRLYRHFDLDRARACNFDLAAHQPGASASRQPGHPRLPSAYPRPHHGSDRRK